MIEVCTGSTCVSLREFVVAQYTQNTKNVRLPGLSLSSLGSHFFFTTLGSAYESTRSTGRKGFGWVRTRILGNYTLLPKNVEENIPQFFFSFSIFSNYV